MSAIKERPILFSAPMVRAILEGRKMVTRRPVKGLSTSFAVTTAADESPLNGVCWNVGGPIIRSPYGKPGERLWVRETWAQPANLDPGPTVYRATYPDCLKGQGWENLPASSAIRWKPSIHMFRRDSRILLEITDVRVERLQDISEDQAMSEGVDTQAVASFRGSGVDRPAGFAFRDLWISINGADAWEANPWVWVVEFKRVTL